jgi:hypothetical protein
MAHFDSGHALLISVGEYQNSKWNAPITVAEAQAVKDALTHPDIGGYPSEQVRLLSNTRSTREGVVAELQRLSRRTTQTDTVTVFFCGHGALGTDGTYYFATHETIFLNNRIQVGTGLSGPDLITLLRTIKAQKLLFIINACFSGHLNPTLGPAEILGAPPSAMLSAKVLASGEGRAMITASRPSQYSYYQRNQEYTFFGQALVDGLRGKAANSGGYIGLYELYQYLYTTVTASAATVNGTQEPVLTILQNVGPFPVALYPGATPADLGTTSIQQTTPTNMAVEVVPQLLTQAIDQGAHAFNIRSSGSVIIDQSLKLIDFGMSNTMGNVTFGDVAGGNITKIDAKITGADAANANTKQELLALIGKLQFEVADLKDAPKGKCQDAEDELRKAKEAGEEGDKGRLLEKLESAQKIILALGTTIPAALQLGETIGALLQRAMGTFF